MIVGQVCDGRRRLSQYCRAVRSHQRRTAQQRESYFALTLRRFHANPLPGRTCPMIAKESKYHLSQQNSSQHFPITS